MRGARQPEATWVEPILDSRVLTSAGDPAEHAVLADRVEEAAAGIEAGALAAEDGAEVEAETSAAERHGLKTPATIGDGTILVITGGDESSQVSPGDNPFYHDVTDTAGITPGPGCESLSATTVRCGSPLSPCSATPAPMPAATAKVA